MANADADEDMKWGDPVPRKGHTALLGWLFLVIIFGSGLLFEAARGKIRKMRSKTPKGAGRLPMTPRQGFAYETKESIFFN